MEINLSAETIETVYNSLRCSKQTLKQQQRAETSHDKKVIIKYQLEEVEDALAVFEELMEII